MTYNLTTLENGCKELGIELNQKQKDQKSMQKIKNTVRNMTSVYPEQYRIWQLCLNTAFLM